MRVTIIEDDPMVSEVLSIALRERGFIVNVCTEQSLIDVLAARPDILVIDIGTPYQLGVQFCQEVFGRLPECKLLPMTGRLEHDDQLVLADGYTMPILQKPFHLHHLLQRIGALAVQWQQDGLVSTYVQDEAFRKISHGMRNVAMVICGSAALLQEIAGDNPTLRKLSKSIDDLCDHGLNEATLPQLQEQCRVALGKSGENSAFRKSAERIMRASTHGIALLSDAASLFQFSGQNTGLSTVEPCPRVA